MIDHEADLTRRLRAAAATIEVPWTPLRRHHSGPGRLAAVGSVAVVLVVALLLGRGLANLRATTTPATSAPTTSASIAQRSDLALVPWPDGARDGWVSPDGQFLVARLGEGLGLYRVNRADTGIVLTRIARRGLALFGSGRWLDDSSGFIFDGRSASPGTTATLDLAVLERGGTVTPLATGVLIYSAQFSHLAPDGRSIAIASPCCPQRVQIVPRAGGTPRGVVEGAPTAWDDRGRLIAYNFRDIIAVASASAPGYRITVPLPPDDPGSVVSVQSAAPDHSAFVVQTGRGSGPQMMRVLVDGRLLDVPEGGLPLQWIGAHELLLYRSGDGRFSAFDPLSGKVRTLGATLPEGGTWWGTNGKYLAWGLRGLHITDVETGETRHLDLPAGDAGFALGVTAPGTFVVTMRDGLRFVDAPALFAQPAPLGQLRDRPTVQPINVPADLTLPPSCRYVRYVDTLSLFRWELDCGEGRNDPATLAAVLQNAGWVRCVDPPTSAFAKGGRELLVEGAERPQEPLVLTERLSGTSCR